MKTGAKTNGMFLMLIFKYKKMFSIFQLKNIPVKNYPVL